MQFAAVPGERVHNNHSNFRRKYIDLIEIILPFCPIGRGTKLASLRSEHTPSDRSGTASHFVADHGGHGIVLLATFDGKLIAPLRVYAVTTKYHVPLSSPRTVIRVTCTSGTLTM